WPNESQILTLGKPNGKLNAAGIAVLIARTMARQRNAKTHGSRSKAGISLIEMPTPKRTAAKKAQIHLRRDPSSVVDRTRQTMPPTSGRIMRLSKWAAPAKL